MRKWSGWLLVLAIAAIVTTGGILSQRYLDRSAYELSSQLERVQQAGDTSGLERERRQPCSP